MAIKNLIAQGIGFSPGSTKYIPTYGFDVGPYNRLVAFDAALALRNILTVNWAADLGLQTTKTVNWDATLGLRVSLTTAWAADLGTRVSKTVGWDAFIGVVVVLPPPTDEEIATALAGRYGPVRLRYRYEKRDHEFNFQADLTEAVEECTITLQNKQAITRTASFSLRTELLGDFDSLQDHIAVWADLLIGVQTVSYNLGLFHLDDIVDKLTPNENEVWEASAADVSIHLWENTVDAPYSLPSGTVYTVAAEALVVLNGLVSTIPASSKVTPVSFTWPIGTSHGQIINDLLEGVNYYPAWADGRGQITSRLREDPGATDAAVTYSTAIEPRMVRPNFGRHYGRARYLNQVVVTVKDPNRQPLSVRITNADLVSPVSTVNKGATTNGQISADRIVDSLTMIDVGSWVVWDAAILAQVANFTTHPDPRRDAHEFYDVTIEEQELVTHWRAEGWTYPCIAGASHTHNIGRAASVLLLTEML